LTKKCLGCPEDAEFCIPENALNRFRQVLEKGSDAEAAWQGLMDAYRARYPELAENLQRALDGGLVQDWDADLPDFKPTDGPMATRAASGNVLNALAAKIDTLIGGSADLAPSNKTYINGAAEYQQNAYEGRNIRFGVREHAMAAIMSGMALHGGVLPYGGTFLVFADYMRPAIRLAALMGLPVIYVFTHDSIAVGEDGPTHQPVEHLASLRAIPGLTVIRPADATETAEAWRVAVTMTDRPVALALTRQKLAVLDRETLPAASALAKGAYVLVDTEGQPDIILMASGSEVHLVLEACPQLAEKGIKARVVSMPSWELFEAMPASYREAVLPADVSARLAVEMGLAMGWERYVGNAGAVIGMNGFGASAPGPIIQEKNGFTVAHVVQTAIDLLKR
jgi:transketolase